MKTYKTEMGQIYTLIYAVIANRVKDNEKTTVRIFANEEDAEKFVKFAKNVFEKLYKDFRISQEILWL